MFFTTSGPADPNVPVNVRVEPTPNSAAIIFTVPNVTYTPETYFVQYGLTTSTSLNLTSVTERTRLQLVDSVHSFITAEDEDYNITITGLVIDRQYYYRVVANNTNGSVTTDVLNFTTQEACESY